MAKDTGIRDLIEATASAEDTAQASLEALGFEPAEAFRRIALADMRTLSGLLIDTESMPPADEALPALREMVEREERTDQTVHIGGLGMNELGELTAAVSAMLTDLETSERWAAGLGLTRHALHQVAGRLPVHPAYAGPYWCSIPAARRCGEFNATVIDNRASERAAGGRTQLTLRTRLNPAGARYIYAAVSDRYTAYDPDRLSTDVQAALGNNASTVRAEVTYNGLATEVRLLTGNSFGFGLMAVVQTADDGTAALTIRAELRLPSGATYGAASKAWRYRHIGHERTVDQIKEALAHVADACEPWIALWQDADACELPNGLEGAIVRLSSGKRPWLRGKGAVSTEMMVEHIRTTLAQAQAGLLPGYKVRATQAGLAELFLVAARMGNLPERAALLQAAGEALANFSAATLGAMVAETESPVAAVNQAANDRLAVLAQRLAGKWTDIAEQAEAEGDAESAKAARERAEIVLVEGDALQELQGKKAPAKVEPASTSKPFEF